MSKPSFANLFPNLPKSTFPRTGLALVLASTLLSPRDVVNWFDSPTPLPASASCEPLVLYKNTTDRGRDIDAGVDKFAVDLVGASGVGETDIAVNFTLKPYPIRAAVDNPSEPAPEELPAAAKVVKDENGNFKSLELKADTIDHGVHGLVSAIVTVEGGEYAGNQLRCSTTTYGSPNVPNPESPIRQ